MCIFSKQAKHNTNFLNTICASEPTKYFDWKVTCIFYIAYHYLKALALHRRVDIGNRHKDILWNINPRNNKRTLQVPNNVFEHYNVLFEYSWTARYDGIYNFDVFEKAKEADYNDAVPRLEHLRKYVLAKGVTL